MAFPDGPMEVMVELYLGAALGWVDAAAAGDVYTRSPISITRGGGPLAQGADPGRASLTLRNEGGLYSPRNPRSPYYGLLGRNTPMRVWARGPETYLWIPSHEARARTGSSAALDVVGDLDVRVDCSLDQVPALAGDSLPFPQELYGRFNDTGTPGNRAWRLQVDHYGQPTLIWSTNGDDELVRTGAVTLPVVSGRRFALRATLDVDNGAAGHTVTFYTAPTLAGPWEQLDAVTEPGTTSVHAPGDASLEVGDTNTVAFEPGRGRYYGAELRDGIDGPLLANPDFTAQTHGDTSFTDSQGNLWQVVNGAELTHFYRRFHGEVAEWPAYWHTSGNDVWADVQAAGILRRLGQGAAPLKSTLRRRIPSGSPLGYWPMEEGREASRAYSPIEGVQPMTVSNLSFAAASTLAGSDALPTLEEGAHINASVLPGADGGWHVELVYKLDQMPTVESEFLRVATTDSPYDYYRVTVVDGAVSVYGVDAFEGTSTSLLFVGDTGFAGAWSRFQLLAEPSGSNIALRVGWVPIGGSGLSLTDTFPGTVGHVTHLPTRFGDDLAGMAIGHLGVFAEPDTTIYNDADMGFAGEAALDRIRRLAQEEGLALTATGGFGRSALVGPQQIATVLDNVEDCADVDGGLLYEQRETLGLAYRLRATFYNPTPGLELDYAAPGEVAPPLTPVDDDRNLRNDVTVTRQGGSSARAVLTEGPLSVQAPPDGAGVYDDAVTVNAASDEQLPGLAHWRLHLGTVDEARYPTVTVNLLTAGHLIERVLSLDVGDTITIANPPAWLPPDMIRLRIDGYTETLKPLGWEIAFNCSPGSPWVVGTLAPDDPLDAAPDGTDRADTSGSQLAVAAGEADTELLVHTTNGPEWMTSAGGEADHPEDFPVDVNAGGEVVRASAIEPMVWDGFSRSVVDGWGTAESGTPWTVSGGGGPPDFDVNGAEGTITLASDQGLLRFGEIIQTLGDAEQLCSIAVDQLPAAGDYLVGCFFRAGVVDAATVLYWVNLTLQADGGVGLQVRNVVTPVGATVATGLTYAPGTRIWLRARVDGHRLRGRVWLNGQNEPGAWTIDRTITTGTADTGTFGIAAASADGASTTPLFMVDDVTVVTPQRFTVTRGINGLQMAHTAGADVRLAQPMVVAL